MAASLGQPRVSALAQQGLASSASTADSTRSSPWWRALDFIPGVFSWAIIGFLILGALVAPLALGGFVLAFHGYWLWRSLNVGLFAYRGSIILRRNAQKDWYQEYSVARGQGKTDLDWQRIHHIVIIPNYTEGLEKLRPTLESLASAEQAERTFAVLALEEREGRPAVERAERLQVEFGRRLAGLFYTVHPAGLPGEIPGKSSNEAWAARWAQQYLVGELGYDMDYLTITSCDADTKFHPKYFSCLAYKFATDAQRYRRFWQAPIFYYNNIWRVPGPLRLPHALGSLNHLARLCRPRPLRMIFPQSTYSLSLRMAHEVGYWDTDVVPEDWHMFLKCFFALRGEVEVEPILLPLYMDGIRSHSYWHTYLNYYQQARRHAWGCSDIPYALRQSLRHPEISLWLRLRRVWALLETHLLWSTQWFLVTVGRDLPRGVSFLFGMEAPPDWFLRGSHLVLVPCMGALIVLVLLDTVMRPPRPTEFRRWQVPIQYGHWFLMAAVTFVFTALPALDAQTRLMLGKRLEYRVTEKA